MISTTTYIFAWAFTTVFTGTFLALGFQLGKWIVEKVKSWLSYRRGLKSNTVIEFLTNYKPSLILTN